jgi:hypothetical protein
MAGQKIKFCSGKMKFSVKTIEFRATERDKSSWETLTVDVEVIF